MGKKETLNINTTGEGLPGMENVSVNTTGEGLPGMEDVKKKELSQPNLASTSDAGTYVLALGNSESSNQPTEDYFGGPIPGQTTQQNLDNSELLPPSEQQWQKELPKTKMVNGKILTELKQTKPTDYDQFKAEQTKNILAGGEIKNNSDALDFYQYSLTKNDPSQLNYEASKMAELQQNINDIVGGKESFNTAEEQQNALKEAQTKLDEHKATIYSKAINLKKDVIGSRFQTAMLNGSTFYQPEIEQLKTLNDDGNKLTPQLDELKRKIDLFPKNERGQIITTPFNKAEVQTSIEQYNDLSQKLQENSAEKQKVSADPKFQEWKQQYDDVTNQYNDLQKEAQNYLNLFPEIKKKVAAEQFQQEKTNKEFENASTTEKIVNSTGRAIDRGILDFVKGITYLPKMVGAGDEYGWTDKFYESAGGGIENFEKSFLPLPTDYNKTVRDYKKNPDGSYALDKNGEKQVEWNLTYLPAKVAYTGTQMAMMIATAELGAGGAAGLGLSGEAGSLAGQFVGGFIPSAESAYSEAIDRGMSEKDAKIFSGILATQQAALELIAPEQKFVKNGFTGALDDYFKAVSGGMGKKEALLLSAKNYSKKVGGDIFKENAQEYSQALDEHYNKMIAGNMTGINFHLTDDALNSAIETGVLTTLTTGLVSGGAGIKNVGAKQFQNEALFMAANDPAGILSKAQEQFDAKKISPENFAQVTQKITLASEELKKIPANISDEQKIKLLPGLLNKRLLEEEKKQTDKVFHPEIDAKIEAQEAELQKKAGIKTEETAEATPKNTSENKTPISATKEVKSPNGEQGVAFTPEDQSKLDYLEIKKQDIGLSEGDQKEFELLTNKKQNNDTQNEQGLSGEIRGREEPIQTESEQSSGGGKIETSGMVQTPSQKEEITPVITPGEEKVVSSKKNTPKKISSNETERHQRQTKSSKTSNEGTGNNGIGSNNETTTPKKTTTVRRGVKKTFRKIKDPFTLEVLSNPPESPHEAVLHYFLSGGSLNADAFHQLWGEEKVPKGKMDKKALSEWKPRFGLYNTTFGRDIPGLAHHLWEQRPGNLKNFTDQDFREAIEDVMKEHVGTSAMREYFKNKRKDLLNEEEERARGEKIQELMNKTGFTSDEVESMLEASVDYWNDRNQEEKEKIARERILPEDFDSYFDEHSNTEEEKSIQEKLYGKLQEFQDRLNKQFPPSKFHTKGLTLNQLINEVFDVAKRIVASNAATTFEDAISRAVDFVKKYHPDYKSAIDNAGITEGQFNETIRNAKTEPEVKKTEPKEKSTQEKPKEKKERKITKRLDENYWNEALDEMTDAEKFYNPTKVEELDKHINAAIKIYEKGGNLSTLAEQLLSDTSPLKEPNVNLRAKFMVGARLREMSKKVDNEFAKQELIRLSARLFGNASQILTAAGTLPGIMNDINDFLPTAEFVQKQAEQQIAEAQDNAMSDKQKQEVKEATKSIAELMESEEVQKLIREKVENLTKKELEEERKKVYEVEHGKEKTDKLLKLRESLTMPEEEQC